MKRVLFSICVICYVLSLNAQNSVPATGGNATGTGGTASFTIGQILYTTNTGTPGSVAQGVQQPYEISIVTSVKTPEDLSIECMVYPNPTTGVIKLVIKPFENNDCRLKLYNANGIILQDKKIENEETEISFEDSTPSVYFLKVLLGNQEIKVFKIVKK